MKINDYFFYLLRLSKKSKSPWYQKYSPLIQLFATIVLIVVTLWYSCSTEKLVNITNKQFILNTNPKLMLHFDYLPKFYQVKDSTVTFYFKNISMSTLVEVNIQYQFYFHLIDRSREEGFIEFSNDKFFRIENFIPQITPNTMDSIILDFRKYDNVISHDSGYFFFKKTLDQPGAWKIFNLRKEFGSMFLILNLNFTREEDGRLFNEKYIFLVQSLPFIFGDNLLYLQNDINDIISYDRRMVASVFERKDIFPNPPTSK